jgi:hypothetical protein
MVRDPVRGSSGPWTEKTGWKPILQCFTECPRHFVPGYDRALPPGLGDKGPLNFGTYTVNRKGAPST